MSYRINEFARRTAFGGLVVAAALAFSWPVLTFFTYLAMAS